MDGSIIKEMLLLDWGYDLPISGGSGTSRDDPIVIETTEPYTASVTTMKVLIGLGLGLGRYWRTLQRSLIDHERPGIEQYKIETVTLTKRQKNTTTTNHYFDISKSMKIWKAGVATLTLPRLGWIMLYEVTWLHFRGLIDHEAAAPGTGLGLEYSAPNMKATVFIYDKERTDIPDGASNEVVSREFEDAAAQLEIVNSGLVPWPDEPFDGDRWLRSYDSAGEASPTATMLAMTARGGHFIKVRVTWERDEFVDEAAKSFVDIVTDPRSIFIPGPGAVYPG